MLYASTCFEHCCAHHQEVRNVLYSICYRHTCRWPSGVQRLREDSLLSTRAPDGHGLSQPAHRTATDSLNLCTGRPRTLSTCAPNGHGLSQPAHRMATNSLNLRTEWPRTLSTCAPDGHELSQPVQRTTTYRV